MASIFYTMSVVNIQSSFFVWHLFLTACSFIIYDSIFFKLPYQILGFVISLLLFLLGETHCLLKNLQCIQSLTKNHIFCIS